MQNKPNFSDTQMNATYVKTKNYEQNTMEAESAKQSQTKPISSTSAGRHFRSTRYAGHKTGNAEAAGLLCRPDKKHRDSAQ
jgi:hypothetical protein